MTGSAISRAQSLALIATGLGAATASPAFAQEATPVRIGFVPGDTFAEAIFGHQAGIFAKAGIDAQLTVLSNAGAVAAAVAGGSIDVATGDIVSLANAINHGVSITLIAGSALYATNAPTTLLCVDGGSPIRTAKELEGKSIAVITLVGLGTASTKAWLAQNGADPSKISYLELPFSSMQPALERGQVAAAVIGEPVLTAARDKIRVIGKPYDAIAKSFLISEWFTTPNSVPRLVSHERGPGDCGRGCDQSQQKTFAFPARFFSPSNQALCACLFVVLLLFERTLRAAAFSG